MIWKEIEGYKYRYRISDQGEFQKFDPVKGWVTQKQIFTGNRPYVNLINLESKQVKVAVVNLMDKYFFDGYARKNGLNIFHKNGSKSDCAVENLEFLTQSEIGKRCGTKSSRKAVIMSKNGIDIEIYPSVMEAANKNGLTKSSLIRRIKGETLDEKGRHFRYEKAKSGRKPKNMICGDV